MLLLALNLGVEVLDISKYANIYLNKCMVFLQYVEQNDIINIPFIFFRHVLCLVEM